MENIVLTAVVGAISAAIVGFYATAFVRPKMFLFLLTPFLVVTMATAALDLAFMAGAEVATFAATARIPHDDKSFEIYTSISDGLQNDFMHPCIYIAGLATFLAIVAAACIPIANKVLRD